MNTIGLKKVKRLKVVKMIERSFVLIKPDGVERGLLGEIIKRFENSGLKIVAMKMLWVDEKFAKEHYKVHAKKTFFKELVGVIKGGPIVVMVIEGVHAVQNVRKLVGPTSPHIAQPGTIRGDFAHVSMDYANKMKIVGKNMIHAADSLKTAKEEIKLWFGKEEIHSYESVHDKHVLK